MLTFLWYLAGLLGCFLVWNSERRLERFAWCPTPRAIILSAFGALGGPVALGLGIIIALMDGTWFTRPLCQRGND